MLAQCLTVDHKTLITMSKNLLQNAGQPIDWLCSFTYGWTMMVTTGLHHTDLAPVPFSIQKGSVLGLILYRRPESGHQCSQNTGKTVCRRHSAAQSLATSWTHLTVFPLRPLYWKYIKMNVFQSVVADSHNDSAYVAGHMPGTVIY